MLKFEAGCQGRGSVEVAETPTTVTIRTFRRSSFDGCVPGVSVCRHVRLDQPLGDRALVHAGLEGVPPFRERFRGQELRSELRHNCGHP